MNICRFSFYHWISQNIVMYDQKMSEFMIIYLKLRKLDDVFYV